jgi:hypothetical protein
MRKSNLKLAKSESTEKYAPHSPSDNCRPNGTHTSGFAYGSLEQLRENDHHKSFYKRTIATGLLRLSGGGRNGVSEQLSQLTLKFQFPPNVILSTNELSASKENSVIEILDKIEQMCWIKIKDASVFVDFNGELLPTLLEQILSDFAGIEKIHVFGIVFSSDHPNGISCLRPNGGAEAKSIWGKFISLTMPMNDGQKSPRSITKNGSRIKSMLKDFGTASSSPALVKKNLSQASDSFMGSIASGQASEDGKSIEFAYTIASSNDDDSNGPNLAVTGLLPGRIRSRSYSVSETDRHSQSNIVRVRPHSIAATPSRNSRSSLTSENSCFSIDSVDEASFVPIVTEGWTILFTTTSETEQIVMEKHTQIVKFRVVLIDGKVVHLKAKSDVTMENVLQKICSQKGYTFSELAFESGPKPHLKSVDMDRTLYYYTSKHEEISSLLNIHNAALLSQPFELWIMKKSKTYSTLLVKSDEGLIMTYQLISGKYCKD